MEIIYDMKYYRNRIIEQIIYSVNEGDFMNSPSNLGWETYREYQEGNVKIIKNIEDIDELKSIVRLIDSICGNNLLISNKRYMELKFVSGICFNKAGRLVILHK